MDKTDVWSSLAAPLPQEALAWRQDGRPVERDGRWYARFFAYVDANTVRERLDRVVPGEWDLTLDLLPPLPTPADGDAPQCSFKARLQILGVIREDVGTGRDYKAAATDAFKRAAVRFGIAHELYALEPNWVPVDGDSRAARALEDPQAAYDRRLAATSRRGAARAPQPEAAAEGDGNGAAAAIVVEPLAGAMPLDTPVDETPECPKCAGRMWDNRLTKRNPKAPDFKCRDRACDGVIWPPRAAAPTGSNGANGAAPEPAEPEPAPERTRSSNGTSAKRASRARIAQPATADIGLDASPLGSSADDDDLPF